MTEAIPGGAAAVGVAGAASVAMMLGSVALLLVFVARLPSDYFRRASDPARARHAGNPTARVAFRVVRNLVGLVLLAAGVAMLVLPGQGLLTILLSLVLLEFPGKRRLEMAVVTRPAVLDGLNALRRLVGRAPFEPPEPGRGRS